MITGYLADLTLNVVSSVGSKAFDSIFKVLKDLPTKKSELDVYLQSVKMMTDSELRNTEEVLERSLSLLMKQKNMEMHDNLAQIRRRLQRVGEEIRKSPNELMITAVNREDIFKSIAMILVSLQYELYGIIKLSQDLYEALQFNEGYRDIYRSLVKAITQVEETWRLSNQALTEPKNAETIYNNLKASREDWVKLIEDASQQSRGEMNEMISGVVLRKPKIFGKKRHIQSLADLVWGFGNSIDQSKISLPELEMKLKNKHNGAEFSLDDLEEAIQLLIADHRAFALNIEDNIKFVEFSKSIASRYCSNCGNQGGIYEEFRECQPNNQFVCDNCISFFGKCKICGQSIKSRHPMLS